LPPPPQPNPAIAALCADIVAHPERYEFGPSYASCSGSITPILRNTNIKVGITRTRFNGCIEYGTYGLGNNSSDRELIKSAYERFAEARIWAALKPEQQKSDDLHPAFEARIASINLSRKAFGLPPLDITNPDLIEFPFSWTACKQPDSALDGDSLRQASRPSGSAQRLVHARQYSPMPPNACFPS
jgi:hypothetical protein